MLQRLWLPGVLLLVLSACGYHFPDASGKLANGVRRVQIPLFENRTLEPDIETVLTNAVVRELGRRRAVQVVGLASPADAVLSGVVVRYHNDTLGYRRGDTPVEYRVTVEADVTLRKIPDHTVLWRATLSRHESYLADADRSIQEDRELAAATAACQRLAEDLYYRLAEGL